MANDELEGDGEAVPNRDDRDDARPRALLPTGAESSG